MGRGYGQGPYTPGEAGSWDVLWVAKTMGDQLQERWVWGEVEVMEKGLTPWKAGPWDVLRVAETVGDQLQERWVWGRVGVLGQQGMPRRARAGCCACPWFASRTAIREPPVPWKMAGGRWGEVARLPSASRLEMGCSCRDEGCGIRFHVGLGNGASVHHCHACLA